MSCRRASHQERKLFSFNLALTLWVTVSNPAMTMIHYYLRIAWNMKKPASNPLWVPLIPKHFCCSWKTNAEWQCTETTLNFPAQEHDHLCTNDVGQMLNRSKMSMQITLSTNWGFNACRTGCSHRILQARLREVWKLKLAPCQSTYSLLHMHLKTTTTTNPQKPPFLRISLIWWIVHLAMGQEIDSKLNYLWKLCMPQFPLFLSAHFF